MDPIVSVFQIHLCNTKTVSNSHPKKQNTSRTMFCITKSTFQRKTQTSNPLCAAVEGKRKYASSGEVTQTLSRGGRHRWPGAARSPGADAKVGRPPLLLPRRPGTDAKVGRPPLLPPRRPGADAKVGRPPLLPPRRPGADAKVGRPLLLPPRRASADAKVGRPPLLPPRRQRGAAPGAVGRARLRWIRSLDPRRGAGSRVRRGLRRWRAADRVR